jgi:thymidylate synthase (FAD)
MKIFTEPAIYLVAKTHVNQEPVDGFTSANGMPKWDTDAHSFGEEIVEFAGRVCYMSFNNQRPGGNQKYIEHILEAGHGSVLEHAVYTFAIEGVSRSLTHELIRHRAGFGFSQLSQRYCDQIAFVLPPAIDENSMLAVRWAGKMGRAYTDYQMLLHELEDEIETTENKTLKRKRAREAARSILPNATETKIVVTGNARAWRHFIEMRGNKDADMEIRRLAEKVLQFLSEESPTLFGDYTVNDGVTTKWKKV